MKTLKKYILGVAMVMALTGCKDKMTELNTNPGIIGITNPEYMFYGAFVGANSGGFYRNYNGEQMARVEGLGTLMQYVTKPGTNYYSDPNKDDQRNPVPGVIWNHYFTHTGQKLNSLVTYLDKGDMELKLKYKDLRAKAKIIQTYMAWNIFDKYGAMPYSEALRGEVGIFQPKYDLYQDMYKGLDDSIKMQIAQLNEPLAATNIETGAFDGFYGVKLVAKTDGGSSQSVRNDADARKLWVKFGNALRIKMAYRVAKRDPAFFAAVVADVEKTPGGLMTSVDEGCQYANAYNVGNDTNTDNQIAYYLRSSMSFINSLKVAEDPRLPLWHRPNGNDTLLYLNNGGSYNGFRTMYFHFPDSLKEMGYYNSKTGFKGKVNWLGRLQQNNVWMGAPTNAASFGIISKLPGIAILSSWMSITINNPAGAGDFISPVDGKTVLFNGKSAVYQWPYSTRPQARYWTKIWQGGFDDGDRFVGNEPAQNDSRLTQKVLSYADQCFTLALVSDELGRSVAGKSAEAWYQDGIRAGLKENNDDAKRTYIPIATSTAYPLFPPYNGTTPDDKHLYTITDEMIEAYVLKHPVSRYTGGIKEAVAVQAWFNMVLNPEEMWSYWKLTGYPRQVDYPFVNPAAVTMASLSLDPRFITSDDTKDVYEQLPTIPAFERPYNNTVQPLDWPRRGIVPVPDLGNIDNYYKVQEALMKTDGYGGAWGKTSTRIWWDNHSTPVVGY